MWKRRSRRRSALKLLVADPSARKRRSRLARLRTAGWIPGRTTPVRAIAIKRSGRSRWDEASPHESAPDTAVLEQDSTAFVEVFEVPTSGGPGHGATIYRLHSADHYLSCSPGQYERLSAVQRTTPVRLRVKNGRRWWWYRDRFWWGDGRLSAREIESTVLTLDLASESQRERFERAQAGLVDGSLTAPAEDAVPDSVRREVWMRDRGLCVDCGVASGLAFDHVLARAVGGSDTAPNLELRCRPCQLRRRTNEARATVGKARIGAHAAKEWGVEVKDISWPS